MEEELLSVKQLSEIFHVHIETIRRWARKKKIIGTKMGKQWYFGRKTVDNI